jgi:hypothetical protein
MNEREVDKKQARIIMGSNAEEKSVKAETTQHRPTPEELSEHLDSCKMSEGPSRLSGGQFTHFIAHVILGVFLFAVGSVLLLVVWPQYANSKAAIPGATLIFFVGGIVLMIAGPCYIVYRICDLIRGARLRTPEETVNTFVRSIEDNNYGRIWNCISHSAKKELSAPEELKNYFKRIKEEIKHQSVSLLGVKEEVDASEAGSYSASISHNFKHDNINIKKCDENTCIANFDLVVEQTRSITQKKDNKHIGILRDGNVIYPQVNGMVRSDKNWFLTSYKII